MRLAIATVVLLAGCSGNQSHVPTQVGPACVALSFASMVATDAPRGGCCQECGGTGKVRSGDGIAMVGCQCDESCPCKASAAPEPEPEAKQAPAATKKYKTICVDGKCYRVEVK